MKIIKYILTTLAVAVAASAGAKNVWMSMFENVMGIDNPGQKLFGRERHFYGRRSDRMESRSGWDSWTRISPVWQSIRKTLGIISMP